MFTLLHRSLVPSYIQLALQSRLPMLCPRADEAGWQEMGLQGDAALAAAQMTQQLEEQGVVLFDRIEVLSLTQSTERIDDVKRLLDTLPAGLTARSSSVLQSIRQSCAPWHPTTCAAWPTMTPSSSASCAIMCAIRAYRSSAIERYATYITAEIDPRFHHQDTETPRFEEGDFRVIPAIGTVPAWCRQRAPGALVVTF